MESNSSKVQLYVVNTGENQYFGGFDPQKGESVYVSDPKLAKKFTNMFDIKLRPNETVVELVVELTDSNVSVSEPFRPSFRRTRR